MGLRHELRRLLKGRASKLHRRKGRKTGALVDPAPRPDHAEHPRPRIAMPGAERPCSA